MQRYDNWNLYQDKIKSLKFLENKEDFIGEEGKVFKITFGIFLLLGELEKDKIPYKVEKYGYVMIIKLPNGKNRFIRHMGYGLISSIISSIFKDKTYTTFILKEGGFKVPKEMLLIPEKTECSTKFNNKKASQEFARKSGYPVIVKPIDLSLGNGFEIINSEKELNRFWDGFNKNSILELYVLQKFVEGSWNRIIYLDGEIIASYRKNPFIVLGDGKSTINDFIRKNELKAELIDIIKKYIKGKGYGLDDIIPEGKKFQLLATIHCGKFQRVEYDQEDLKFIQNIAKAFGADYFGIDIIGTGKISKGTVMEINSSPGIKLMSKYYPEFIDIFANKIWSFIKKQEGLL